MTLNADGDLAPSLVRASTPLVERDTSAIEDIVQQCASASAEVCLEQRTAHPEGQLSPEVVTMLQRLSESTPSFDVAWHPCFGRLRRAMFGGGVDDGALAHVAGHVSSFEPFEWRIVARFEERLLWQNVILPASRNWDVIPNHAGDDVRIGLDHSREIHLQRADEGWISDDLVVSSLQASGNADRPFRIVEASSVSGFQPVATASSLSPAEVGEMCDAALTLLRECSPAYHDWIGDVVRYVVPLDGTDGVLRSASDDYWPGMLQISFPSKPAALAEMFVHETAHQYFHIVRALGPVHDDSDTRLYFSPVKQKERPLDRVLLAYHAFANVLLFYDLCIKAGLDDDEYCRQNYRRHVRELEVLEQHLRGNPALTRTGQLLCEPLWKCLASVG